MWLGATRILNHGGQGLQSESRVPVSPVGSHPNGIQIKALDAEKTEASVNIFLFEERQRSIEIPEHPEGRGLLPNGPMAFNFGLSYRAAGFFMTHFAAMS